MKSISNALHVPLTRVWPCLANWTKLTRLASRNLGPYYSLQTLRFVASLPKGYHCRVLVVAAQSSGHTCHLACKEKVVCRPCSLASSKSWINPILGLVAARYSCKMVAGVRLGACKEKVFCLLSHSFAVLAVPPQVDIAVLPL